MQIFSPIVEHMKLQVRMNVATRQVELRVRLHHAISCHLFPPSSGSYPLCKYAHTHNPQYTINAPCLIFQTCPATTDSGALQKAADFIKAFMLGFAVQVCYSMRTCRLHGCLCNTKCPFLPVEGNV